MNRESIVFYCLLFASVGFGSHRAVAAPCACLADSITTYEVVNDRLLSVSINAILKGCPTDQLVVFALPVSIDSHNSCQDSQTLVGVGHFDGGSLLFFLLPKGGENLDIKCNVRLQGRDDAKFARLVHNSLTKRTIVVPVLDDTAVPRPMVSKSCPLPVVTTYSETRAVLPIGAELPDADGHRTVGERSRRVSLTIAPDGHAFAQKYEKPTTTAVEACQTALPLATTLLVGGATTAAAIGARRRKKLRSIVMFLFCGLALLCAVVHWVLVWVGLFTYASVVGTTLAVVVGSGIAMLIWLLASEPVDKKTIGQKLDVVFDYFPQQSPLVNGWTSGKDVGSGGHTAFDSIQLPDGTKALQMAGPATSFIEFEVPHAFTMSDYFDIRLRLEGDFTLYALCSLECENGERMEGWLIVIAGAEIPAPREGCTTEWRYYVQPVDLEGGWGTLRVAPEKAIAETFGHRFRGLLRFRIRGSISLARISLGQYD